MFNSKIKTGLFLAILLCMSCQSENLYEEPENEVKMTLPEDAMATLNFLKDQGYLEEDLEPDLAREAFIYAEDMAIPFGLKPNLDKNVPDDAQKNQWYLSLYGVFYVNSRNITYYIDYDFPSEYILEFAWAAYHWSKVSPNININRTYSRYSADIVLGAYYNENTGAYATAALPSGNGNVGSWMQINVAKDHEALSAESRMTLMIHELGHNLSFLHSNQVEGIRIPGTSDAAFHQAYTCGSIMRSSVYVCGWQLSPWSQWSSDDWRSIGWSYGVY